MEFTYPYSGEKVKLAFSHEKAVAIATAPPTQLKPWPAEFDEGQKWRIVSRIMHFIKHAANLRKFARFIHYEELLERFWYGRKQFEDPESLPEFMQAWLKLNGYTYTQKEGGFEVDWGL